ncbi:hypothetical protein PspLS_01583 [Pyricularia sp. CBS 133598]|nr:hypothetical protein PspLS_01583 [Pyricularia sp. CBS 133598]
MLIGGEFDTKLDVSNSNGERPVEYAATKGMRHLIGVASLSILLQSRCAVHPGIFPFPTELVKAQIKRFSILFAMPCGKDSLASDLGLSEQEILDFNAAVFFETLVNLGVEVPKALDPREPLATIWVSHSYKNQSYRGDWSDSSRIMNSLWDRGFRDLDAHSLRYCCWCVEHGADIWTPSCQRQCINSHESDDIRTPAHFLLAYVDKQFRPPRSADVDIHDNGFDNGTLNFRKPTMTSFPGTPASLQKFAPITNHKTLACALALKMVVPHSITYQMDRPQSSSAVP